MVIVYDIVLSTLSDIRLIWNSNFFVVYVEILEDDPNKKLLIVMAITLEISISVP